MPAVLNFLQPWSGLDPETAWLLYAGAALVLLIAAVVAWLALGRGPRRRRAYQRALALIQQKDWQQALAEAERLKRLGRLSPAWQGRAQNLEGQCRKVAGDEALEGKRYEESLEHYRAASQFLSLDQAECRNRVVDRMLAEVRRLFASSTGPDTEAVHKLIGRVRAIQPACAEASFWQGLCHVREGRNDQALAALTAARESAGPAVLDPALYLGTLLLREGRTQEALRQLSEANRIEPGCPLVMWQLGIALCASAGQDAGRAAAADGPATGAAAVTSPQKAAVRALQKAFGPRGLPAWIKAPQQLWKEGLPGQARSFVRRLAEHYPYYCPVFGNDVAAMDRQGRLALAGAHYRLGNFQDAANVFDALLQECPPSAPVVRGLGLALARLGRYDQAFTHLRAAYEMEQPKDRLTAGYLALCGARGKPVRPEDKAKNVAWAIQLLAQFPDGEGRPGDPEWAELYNAVFGEARSAGVSVTAEDQARLCDVLAAARATDPSAAAAYAELATAAPGAVRLEHACLYARALELHRPAGEVHFDLIARAFHDPQAVEAAREFDARHGWDFEEMEYFYLEACARRGAEPVPEYAVSPGSHGERLLLDRSRRQEAAGRSEAALASVQALLRLDPSSAQAHDRLAHLHYRRGELDRAAELLAAWHEVDQGNHLPLLRQAVIQQQLGNAQRCNAAIDQARGMTHGSLRAAVAFLGARLALAFDRKDGQPVGDGQPMRRRALSLLEECVREDPDHVDALWCLAAVRLMEDDRDGLAAQAALMSRPEVAEPRFHFLAAVCHLAAGNHPQVLEECARAAADPGLAAEAPYLMGWAHLNLKEYGAAAAELHKTATATPESPSADHARALLGQIRFACGAYQEAALWWGAVDPDRRAEWKFDTAMRAALFLAGLEAFKAGQYESAARHFREVAAADPQDARLAPLQVLALLRGAQRLLYPESNGEKISGEARAPEAANDRFAGLLRRRVAAHPSTASAAARLLEEALAAGAQDPNVSYLLALAYKHAGKPAEAQAVLGKLAQDDPDVCLQVGILALRQKRPAEAEKAFARAAELDPAGYEACRNLAFTRLSLGQVDQAEALFARAIGLAPTADEQRLLALLQRLLAGSRPPGGERPFVPALAQMAEEDERRLLDLLRGIGHLDTAAGLIKALAGERPESRAVAGAELEAAMLTAKRHLDRCAWAKAERLLAPLVEGRKHAAGRPTRAALLNLLGCCVCLGQNFEAGLQYFLTALNLNGNDVRVYQNAALACELDGRMDLAEPHWEKYLELMDRRLPVAPGEPDYLERLGFEAVNRLASAYSDKEKWTKALEYLQRAERMRPEDPDVLERLFHLYTQIQRPKEAGRVLRKLRQVRADEPLFELYQLELVETRNLDDIEHALGEIDRVVQKHHQDPRIEERAGSMVAGHLAYLNRLARQLAEQLDKAVGRLRRLPNHANWPEMDDYLRDLRGRFSKLKRTTNKCLPLVTTENQRQSVRELIRFVEREIERCAKWVGE